MNFGMTILGQNVKTMQTYVIWILLALLFILNLKIWFNDNDIEMYLTQNENKSVAAKRVIRNFKKIINT